MVRKYNDKWSFLKTLFLCAAATVGTIISPYASSEMIPLSSDELSAVQAAGTGVSISLDVAINGSFNSSGFIPNSACADTPGSGSEFCRFGFQGGNSVFSWLLLKQLGGYFSVPKLLLYGTTVNPAATGLQSALVIEMKLPSPTDRSSQIRVRDLYFNMAVAATPCDTYRVGGISACSGRGTSQAALDDQNAYFDTSVFQIKRTIEHYSVIDAGKETGFLGVRMNGNLNVGGSIIVFSK